MSERDKTLERKKLLVATAAALIGCTKSGGGNDMGYGVVDPMPAPARCPDLENLKPTAKTLPDGTIEVTIPPPPAGSAIAQTTAPVVSGATLMKTTTSPQGTVLILRTDADAGLTTNADVQVHGSCTGAADVTLHVTVYVREKDVQVSVYEQR
jgi:hypothetical protein